MAIEESEDAMSILPLTGDRPRRRLPVAISAALLVSGLVCISTSAGSQTPPEPAETPAAPTEIPAVEQPGESALEVEPALPKADEIVAAYIAAVGGEAALREHTSMRATGVFEMPSMGLSGTLEILGAAPDRLLVRVDVPGVGEILQGANGEVAWSDNPMTGPSILEGAARDEALRQSDFYAELAYPELYPEMETVARTVLDDGAAVYKVRLVDSSGKESFHYFSVDSGLLLGTEGEQDTPMGRVYVSTRAGGYKEIGGRLMATELRQSTMGMDQTMTIQEVEFDGVSDDTFALPETIRALLEPAAPTSQ